MFQQTWNNVFTEKGGCATLNAHTVGQLGEDTDHAQHVILCYWPPKRHSVCSLLCVHNLPLGNKRALLDSRQIHNGSDYGPFFVELSRHYGHSRKASCGWILSNDHTHSPLLFAKWKTFFLERKCGWDWSLGGMPSLLLEHQVRGCLQQGYTHVPSLLLLH